jgi:hypothetical protein
MLIRFRDSNGTEWEAWVVSGAAASRYPSRDGSSSPRAGWLCFESSAERRRLADYPLDWYERSPLELSQLCARATPSATPARGTPVYRDERNSR